MHHFGKTALVATLVFAFAATPAFAAPQQWKNVLKKAASAVQQKTTQGTQAKPNTQSTALDALSSSTIVRGLKDALANGATTAIKSLGKPGGFWNSNQFRIPLPPSLDKAAKLARSLGQGAKVDAFQQSLNSAAEKAVPAVAGIFGDAIRNMSVTDARNILTGGDHAATDYFARVAGKSLKSRIEPIVAKATDSVGVTAKYKALVGEAQSSRLGGLLSSLSGKHDASSSLNLDDYVTNAAVNALFTEIGSQEKAIRDNPAARTTSILKKVFGAK